MGVGPRGIDEQESCTSCGEPLRAGARFCGACGAPHPQSRPDLSGGRSAPPPRSAPPAHYASDDPFQQDSRSAPFYGPAAIEYPTPPGYPTPPPAGYPTQAPGFEAQTVGYPAHPEHPPPPEYAAPAVGYPTQPPYVPPPQDAPAGKQNTGWLVAGILAAVLVIAGIGVGVYLVVSTGSGGQAQLLSTPVVNDGSTTSGPVALPTGGSTQASAGTPASVIGSHPAVASPSLPPSVATSSSRSAAQSAERQAVAGTIQRHFALISEHKFTAAYALLAPSLQSGESSWVASHKEDGIYKVDVLVNAKLDSSDSATATVMKMTTLDSHGCKSWSGSWNLTKIGGQWRISESHVSSVPC
jgi:zinc-ribbon domain